MISSLPCSFITWLTLYSFWCSQINRSTLFILPFQWSALYHVATLPGLLYTLSDVVRLTGLLNMQGRIQRGAHPAPPPPLKLEKIWFFGVKSWFFTRNTQTIFAPPSARRSLLKCAPPNLKSWIHPWYVLPFQWSAHFDVQSIFAEGL